MIDIFKTLNGSLQRIDEISEGCWISMTAPSATELMKMAEVTGVDIDHLRAPLDDEERARIEVEDKYTLILVDIPSVEKRYDKDRYITIPLGIIVAEQFIITVCLEETPVLKCFIDVVSEISLPIRRQDLYYRSFIEMHQPSCRICVQLTERVRK